MKPKVMSNVPAKTSDSVPAKATEPFALIAAAVQSGQIDVETVKELVALQREMKADAAQEAYVRAMAEFQAECPIIEKNKPVKNKNGQVVYYYAQLDTILSQKTAKGETVAQLIAKNGLSYTFDVSSDDKELTGTCIVTHVSGHTKRSPFKVPIGSEQYMTDVQKFGARATYAKRNAFANAFGILTGDEDTDATDVGKDNKPRDIKSEIIFLYRALGFDATASKDATEKKTKELTQLDLIPENFEEVRDRLKLLVDERNEDKSKV